MTYRKFRNYCIIISLVLYSLKVEGNKFTEMFILEMFDVAIVIIIRLINKFL